MDLLTYIDDLNSFRAECKQKALDGNEFFSIAGDDINYHVSKIPVVYNGLKSVCLVRLTTVDEVNEFNSLTSIERIGEHEAGNDNYTFDDGGEAKYDSVYDQSTIIIDSESYTPPPMIGVFA